MVIDTAWKSHISSIHVVAPVFDRQKYAKPKSSAFCLTLKKIGIPYTGNRDDMNQATYQVYVSLFDLTFNQFIGNRWESPQWRGQCDTSDKLTINCNELIYFHTSIADESIVLVVEVICRTSGTQSPKSTGWGLYRLFKYESEVVDCSVQKEPPTLQFTAYHGSSRALFYLDEPVERNPALKAMEGLNISFTIRTHHALEACTFLFPENVFVSKRDKFPGLQSSAVGMMATDALLRPEPAPIKTFVIEKLKLHFDPGLLDFETALKDLLNKDRIARDNRDKEKDGRTVEIAERRLRVGVHNGWAFTDDVEIVHMSVISSDSSRRSSIHPKGHARMPSGGVGSSSTLQEGTNLLAGKHPVELEFSVDPSFALVFVLEYAVIEPKVEEDRKLTRSMAPSGQLNYAVQWGAVLPFSEAIGALAHPEGTALEVEFKGGPDGCPDGSLCYKAVDTVTKVSLSAIFKDKNYMPAQGDISKSDILRPPQSYPTNGVAGSDAGSEIMRSNQIARVYAPTPQMEDPQLATTGSQPLSGSLIGSQAAQMLLYSQMIYSMSRGSWAMPTPGTMDGGSFERLRPVSIPAYAPGTALVPMPIRMHSGKGLSRAAYARLYSAGFARILDYNDEAPDVIDPLEETTLDMGKEERDPLQCNEIIFQFLAYARMFDEDLQDKRPKNIFCTFQFYRFPQYSTERLSLNEPISDIASDPFIRPYILQKVGKDGSTLSTELPGYQVKYSVDPNFLKPGEGHIFIEHLSQQTLHIDVWDGDSLLLIGTCAVELKHLCRQARPAVQVTYELNVIATADCGEDDFSQGLHSNKNPSVRGVLHLRLANVGYRPSGRSAGMKVFAAPKKRCLVESMDKSKFFGGSLSRTQCSVSMGGLSAEEKRVIRAHKAAESSRELAELLVTKRSQGLSQDATSTEIDGSRGQQDEERRRKLARLAAVRKLNPESEPPNPATISILAYRADKADRARDLRTIDIYRASTKREYITTLLSSAVAGEHHLYPAFGVSEFFEFQLKNPYNTEQTVDILFEEDSGLSLLTDPREVRALKLLYNVSTPTEDDLFSVDTETKKPTLFLRPKETLLIPFKYVELSCSTSVVPQAPMDGTKSMLFKAQERTLNFEKTVRVTFQSTENQLVAQLMVHVSPQPPVVDQAFRFYQPEQSFLKKVIRLPPFTAPSAAQGMPSQVFTRCSDDTVVLEPRPANPGEPHDIYVKVASGTSPQVRQFLIAVYVDPFLLRPAQVWQMSVHAQQRVDCACLEGQTSKLTLLLRGTSSSRQVRVYTSHPREIQVDPEGPMLLAAGAVHELQVIVTPLVAGSRMFQVQVVDCELQQLIRTWLLCVQCRSPEVTKSFELDLPMGGGKGSNKRVSYTNPYPHRKVLYLTTNRPDLLQFRENEMTAEGGQTVSIGLRFNPNPFPGTQNILVFVNDEEGKNEETFSVSAVYK